MSFSFLKTKQSGSFLEVTLNDPERRNPLSSGMIDELLSVLSSPEAMDAQGLIIAASGPVFSAGHDFSDMLGKDLETLRNLMHACANLMQSLQRMPQPVLAKVQGPAMAAGCQLALSCDLVVASENAFFQTPGGRSGWFCFTPMVALTRSIGGKRAFEMLMSGEPIAAQTAYEWGMINRVVAPELLDKEALDLMGKVTQGSPRLRAMGKKAFYTQIEMPVDQAYRYATDMMALTGITEDPQERMRAFVEKRPPVFKK